MTDEERNPFHHTTKMRQRLGDTIDHMRSDIGKVDDPQFKAMFETAAEVLAGLVKAFSDYERKNEAAWKSEEPLPGPPEDVGRNDYDPRPHDLAGQNQS
jgi:hypothetical protein